MLPVLPDDVLVHMFHFFDTTTDAFTGCQVSKQWKSLLEKRCPWLWRTMRVSATHGVCCDTAIVTRTKRKRYSVFLGPLLRIKGSQLYHLSLGTQHHLCDMLLTGEHLRVIAAACPQLQKLKLYVTDTHPELPMSALNHVVVSCPALTTLALPINAASVVMDELPVKYMSVQKLRLHGDLTVRGMVPTHVWLGASLTTLQLVDVCDVDQVVADLDMLRCCTRLQHLIIHNCSSRADHPLHLFEHDGWMQQLACQLRTLGIVRSSTLVCTASLLTSLAAASILTHDIHHKTPWCDLRDLWLDARIFPGDNYQTECLFTCLGCTRYFIYKRSTATEILRCHECQRQKFPRLEAVYLVD